MKKSSFKKNIFVGCSASIDINKEYITGCEELLDTLFEFGNSLIFGASTRSLMGLSYNVAKAHNCNIVGVCPEVYKSNFKTVECTEIITDSVSNRTKKMIDLSDIILFLPGGIGTVYEFFSALESKRADEFDKPIIVYNLYGYYDELLKFMDKVYQEKFSKVSDKEYYFISDSIDEIVDYIKKYKSNLR